MQRDIIIQPPFNPSLEQNGLGHPNMNVDQGNNQPSQYGNNSSNIGYNQDPLNPFSGATNGFGKEQHSPTNTTHDEEAEDEESMSSSSDVFSTSSDDSEESSDDNFDDEEQPRPRSYNSNKYYPTANNNTAMVNTIVPAVAMSTQITTGGAAAGGLNSNRSPSATMNPSPTKVLPKEKDGGASWNRNVLYETMENWSAFFKFYRYKVVSTFLDQAIIIHERSKYCWCCPSTKAMTVVPKYQLTDVQTISKCRHMPWWWWFLLISAIVMFAFVPIFQDYCYDSNWNRESCMLPGGKILITIGCIFLLWVLAVLFYRLKRKRYMYVLKYTTGRHCCSVCCPRRSKEIAVLCHRKVDQEFLYGYVYDSLEQANDPQCLHRFNHLSTNALMDPVRDWHTPDSLLTATQSTGVTAGKDDSSPQQQAHALDVSSSSSTHKELDV